MFNDLHHTFRRFAAAHQGRGGHHHHPRWDHGFWGPGGRGMPGGRKLSSGDLQLVILALLEKQPAHGYELIRAIEERSGGFYKPSSGMVYPALTYLEEIGQTVSAAEANRKLYTITKDGEAFLAEHRDEADAILHALGRIGGRMADVREAFAGLNEADPASDELHAARTALKHALHLTHGCGPGEARRVARILHRAAGEILGRPGEDPNAAEGAA